LEKKRKKIFLEEKYAEKFFDIYTKIDGNRNECDQNKLELLKFWDTITDKNPEITKDFANINTLPIILDFFISIRPRQIKFIEYNNDSLPYFYSIVYRLCDVNNDFLEKWMNNNNFLWAVQHLLVESQTYNKVAPTLENILDLCFKYKPQYKLFFIDKIIEFGLPHLAENFFTIIGLSRKLLNEKEEKIHFCQENGLWLLINSLNFSRDWNPDMIKLLLETIILSITWFSDESNIESVIELKGNIIATLKEDLVIKLENLKQSISVQDVLDQIKCIELYFNIVEMI